MSGTNYQKMVKVFAPEFDEFYIAMCDVQKAHGVNTARAYSLDQIGYLLEFERNVSETDDEYRTGIINMVGVNTAAGTKDALREVVANFLRIDTNSVEVKENQPNYLEVHLPTEYSEYEYDIRQLVLRSIAAGVYVKVTFGGTYWDDALWDNEDDVWG